MGFLVQGGAPPDDSVTTAKIQDDAVTSAKVAAGVLPGKNLIINSDFGIWQRGTAFPAAANGLYTVDRWKLTRVGAGVLDIEQDTSVPANDSAFSCKLSVDTADASVAASDFGFFHQRIEAFNTDLLALGTADAKQISVSFWARSSVADVFTCFLQNSAQDRTYVHEFTIASADTWERFTFTLTGDTTGTWISGTNGIGLIVGIGLWGGSNSDGTNDTWNAGSKFTTTNSNETFINTASATFYLSRFQVEVGSAASVFEYRDYASELVRCLRYYWRDNVNTGALGGYNQNGFAFSTSIGRMTFPGHFRSSPTVRVYPAYNVGSGWLWNDGTVNTAWSGAPSLLEYGTNSVGIQASCASTLTKGHGVVYYNSTGTNGYLELDSEL